MFEHITLDIILLLMLYAVVATVSAVACVYLLLRRGNAFTRRISTPKRLRRWTAAFFGIVALGHLWYLPGDMMADGDAATLWMLIGALLDCMLTMPLALVVMLCMLQDRKRPLWIAWLIMAPLVILSAVSVGMRSYALVQWMQGYFMLMAVGFTAYMVRQVRQYGRWLRDKLYLQTDLTSVQLAQALGTNRTYLGMYFSRQGTTYNAYINTLRINYFIELFRQASAAAEGQSIQAKQLAARSGYRSYRTFSVAFKQRTGQSVTAWMNEEESA